MSQAKITGTFVDFSELTHQDTRLLNWSVKDWVEELSDMKNAGISTAILARTMRYGAVYYFSNFFETHLERDYMTPFMEAAKETGTQVFISGMISDHFFTANDANFQRMMKRDVYIYDTVISELLDIYSSYGIISGIYVSHEADNENLGNATRLESAKEFFGNLYTQLHKKTELPILSSPFFTKRHSPQELAEFWHGFLDRPMFDILAMQDGVGCNRDITPEDIPGYYAALQPVLLQNKIEFWNNVETFSFHPGYRASGNDRSKIWLKTAPIDRVSHQYEAGKAFASRSIMWEYGHFFSRKQAGSDHYDCFRNWNLQIEI
jgi:hypothetical protein